MIDANSYVIGVDIGTTSTKAVVFNGNGEVKTYHTAGYALLTPAPGVAEQNPLEIYATVLEAIRDAIRATRETKRIRCVGFSAAMHSLIPVDSDGRPMTASITWADTRSAAWAENIVRDMDGHGVYLRTGTPIHPMSPLAKLVWLRHEHPELFERAYRFVGIK
jgi:gluconokinase